MKIKEWLDKQLHMPKFMRDFHDQKDLFKTIHGTMNPIKDNDESVNWVQAQIYTCDTFLTFMAQCGYTLQKTRMKGEFCDAEAVVSDHMKTLRGLYTQALKNRLSEESTFDNQAKG